MTPRPGFMAARGDALDVQLAGTIFLDLVFSGPTGQPRLGTEIRTAGLGSSPGGVANLAVALARLDLRVGLTAAFSTDLYGGYLCRTLGEREGMDLSASRQVVGWATPVTVSLAYERERTMITALMAHPFVKRKAAAEAILEEGLAAHRANVPQFFRATSGVCGERSWVVGPRD